MINKTGILLLMMITICICAFKSRDAVVFHSPKGWPAPVYNFKENPLNEQTIALGRRLFFDPLLSRNNTISCASCHLPQTAFTHVDHDLSHGIDNRIGTRNSLALINLAWSNHFMWDGAVHHLDVQALAPITNHDEMDENIGNVIKKIQTNKAYANAFTVSFGDSGVTGERTLKALSQYMLTLVSADAKYDKVMRKESTFNEFENRGYTLFKANCAVCHREPLFTNGGFENNGLAMDTTLNDTGRIKITGKAADRQRFKVPTLRNIEVTYPYMHDGRFRSLQMVLFHYTNSVQQSPSLSQHLRNPLQLTEDNKRDLIAFLKTLTDENFLYNTKFQSDYTQISTP